MHIYWWLLLVLWREQTQMFDCLNIVVWWETVVWWFDYTTDKGKAIIEWQHRTQLTYETVWGLHLHITAYKYQVLLQHDEHYKISNTKKAGVINYESIYIVYIIVGMDFRDEKKKFALLCVIGRLHIWVLLYENRQSYLQYCYDRLYAGLLCSFTTM